MIRSLGCWWYCATRPGVKIGRIIHIGSGLLAGAMWGLLPVLFFSDANLQQQVLMSFALGGISVGALVVSGYYPPSFYALCLPSLTPLIVMIFAQNSMQYTGMGLMLIVFLATILILGSSFGRTLANFLELQIARTNLLTRLQENSEILSAALKAGHDTFAMFDENDRLVIWNRSFSENISPLAGPLKVGISFSHLIKVGAQTRGIAVGKEEDSAWYKQRMALHSQPGSTFETNIGDRWFLVQEVRTPTGHAVLPTRIFPPSNNAKGSCAIPKPPRRGSYRPRLMG
ncbi:PAS-domain containing protein [Iodidimonas gelatinilytica]|nr:PAS-domain containing protein [Iodidimonas gelatinilytica]